MTGATARRPSIVVGVTDTDSCRDAVAWAAREALRRGAILALVVAYEPLRVDLDGVSDDVPTRTRAAELLDGSAALAEDAAPGVDVSSHLIEGLPVGALADLARDADLIVVGSRARNRFTADAVGTVGVELGAAGAVPIVIVRGPGPADAPEALGLPIVAAVDGAARSTAVVEFAVAEARSADVPMVVAHIGVEPKRDLASAAVFEAARAAHPEVRMRYLGLAGGVKESLSELSTRARLLVVGSRGRRRFAGMVLGSVAQSLTCSAQCPLVVIPPRWQPLDAVPAPAAGARDVS